MKDPQNHIDWTDEALAASIFIFAVILIVTNGPSIALWFHNQ